jgi:quaternary ammonium compound-resistance protein SugE
MFSCHLPLNARPKQPTKREESAQMAWLYLFVAGLFETAWAIGLKYSAGFTKLGPSLFTVIAMLISIYLLAVALRTLPVGTGYAVWTGIGSVGAAILGILLFNESREFSRILCILLIVAGIIGLKLTAPD